MIFSTAKNKTAHFSVRGLVLCFCILFFLFDKVPGKIHYRPDDHKKEGHSEEVKVFSEDFGKKLENGVSRGSVEEEEVCTEKLVDKEDRNTFAKKNEENLRKALCVRSESAGKKKQRIHFQKNVNGV